MLASKYVRIIPSARWQPWKGKPEQAGARNKEEAQWEQLNVQHKITKTQEKASPRSNSFTCAVRGMRSFLSAGPRALQEAVVCGAGMSGRFNWLWIYYLGWPE